MAKNYFILLLFTATTNFYAQKPITAKLLDSSTKKEIPFATVTFNNKSGVISNENGVFQLYINVNPSETDSLFLSCLGYENKNIAVLKFTDSIIYLDPKSIELDQVLVSNKTYTAEEIIEKANENLERNYKNDFKKSTLFFRESYYSNHLKNEAKVKTSTIPEINQKLVDSVLQILPKQANSHTEILAELYAQNSLELPQKLNIVKAAHLYNKNDELSLESLEEKFNLIFKKHIKRDSYFKIKSGIFGVKQDIDSSFFGDNDNPEKTEAYLEDQEKLEQDNKAHFLKHRKQTITDIEKKSFTSKHSFLDLLKKTGKYNLELSGLQYIDNDFVYKITFTPKRSATYQGTAYISTDDFAIIRLEYKNVKPLRNFNLFGISYNESVHKGIIMYSKSEQTNIYNLKYAESETFNKIGFKRPLKIIEKNKHTKGRRKQNELETDLHFIVTNKVKKELVVFENTPITETQFNDFTEHPDTKPTYLPRYDPEFWNGHNVIEPNQAIKNFKSLD